MESRDPRLLPRVKMERAEWGMFDVEKGLKMMQSKELEGVRVA